MVVLRSAAHVVSIGGHLFTLVAEDWDNMPIADKVAKYAQVQFQRWVNLSNVMQPAGDTITKTLDKLANGMIANLRLPDRPLGRSLILEPM